MARASFALVMIPFALVVAVVPPVGLATHEPDCVHASAPPETYVTFQTVDGRTLYEEHRGDGSVWTYEESNGIDGLQRGGGSFPVPEDPVTDETCGHGPDTNRTGTSAAHFAQAFPQGSFRRSSPAGPIEVDGFPFCTVTVGASQASVVCASSARCTNPGLVASATAGTVSGSTACTGSRVAEATATAPGSDHDLEPGVFAFPWFCQVTFGPLATGALVCDAPDP